MSRLTVSCIVALILVSCGTPSGRFRLEGRLKNLNQGDFYVCNLEAGTIDTLHVKDGRLNYDAAMEDTTLLTLVFPNFSQLPIVAAPGTTVKLEGDASHLKEVELKGTRENADLTEFRLATAQMPEAKIRIEALRYMEEHAKSVGCVYLLRKYFLNFNQSDPQETLRLTRLLAKAQPQNKALLRIKAMLERGGKAQKGQMLPPFTATDSKGRSVSRSQLNGKVNVVCTWAAWCSESQTMMHQLRAIERKHPGQLKVVSICLDASANEGRYTLENDSINWPNICTGELWNTPLLRTLGIETVPGCIVADKNGRIIERDLTPNDLREFVERKL